MSSERTPIAVLNPFGRDTPVDYASGIPGPDDGGHAPCSYHGYAACCGGSYHRDPVDAARTGRPILLILRTNLRANEKAIAAIRAAAPDAIIAAIVKETGTHQLMRLLSRGRNYTRFGRLLRSVDGCVASTDFVEPIYRALRNEAPPETTQLIPTPYPIEDERWSFARSFEERDGLVIGTREFRTQPRCHLLAIAALGRIGCRVSVMNADGRYGSRLLDQLRREVPTLEVLEGRRSYAEYVRWLAGHRAIFQWDQSLVPGQVAGDAALAQMPCIGGNGLLNRLLYPATHGDGRRLAELVDIAREVTSNADASRTIVEQMTPRAIAEISYAAGAHRLAEFFETLRAARSS